MEVDESAASLLQAAAANLLSDIKNGCKTTQKAVDLVVSGVNNLVEHYLNFIKERFDAECSMFDGNINLDQIHSVISSLRGQSVFEGVGTNTSLNAYLQEHSGGKKVTLKKVVLESRPVLRNGIPRSIPTKFGYMVSFLPQLEQLLNCKDVLECVDNPLPPREGVLRTVSEGLAFKYNSVVLEKGPKTLIFIIHVDDAEVCDPCKSKAGIHNLRLFYWVLANIHPKKRSSLKAINLLAIVKAKVAKIFGNSPFLKDFIDAMKMLGTEGVDFNINGVIRRFYGVLLFVSADNPAAANLGGFKETHFALRPCRVCMIKSGDMNSTFVQSANLLRKIDEHEKHLRQVIAHDLKHGKTHQAVQVIDALQEEEEETDVESDIEVANEVYLDHKNPSVNFGVNSACALAACPGFDVTKYLPQDVMHLLAEGVVQLLCRKLLKDLCIPQKRPGVKKRAKAPLSLKSLNDAIEKQCDLGHFNVSKPSRIEFSHIKGSKLKQSASQLLVLLHLLPFLIARVCPPEKMKLLTTLNELVNLGMSFEFSDSDIARIDLLAEEFARNFMLIYPNVRSLKLHCLAHLGMQCRLFGPLRQQACFRFEAMHFKFTSIAPVVRSKKNIALSCASRYMSERNAELMKGKATGSYLYEADIVTGPSFIEISSLPEKETLLERYPDLSENDTICKVKQVSEHSNKWHNGVAIVVEHNGQSSLFGRIEKVFVTNEGQMIFLYYDYVTRYVSNLNAFEILRCDNQVRTLKLSELMHPFPIARFSFNIGRTTVAYLLLQSPGGII